jgi:hypothetical protein
MKRSRTVSQDLRRHAVKPTVRETYRTEVADGLNFRGSPIPIFTLNGKIFRRHSCRTVSMVAEKNEMDRK